MNIDAGRLRRAFHEAGHAVVAAELGIDVVSVTIDGDENFAGNARMRQWLDVGPAPPGTAEPCEVREATDEAAEWFAALPSENIPDVLERQVCVLTAGGAGERMYEQHDGVRPQGEFHVGADNRLIDAHLKCLYPDDANAQEGQRATLRTKAERILRERTDRVTELAQQLYEGGTVLLA